MEIEGNQVLVLAATEQAAEAARDILEYSRETVAIKAEEAGLLIGKGGKNIRDIQIKCRLFQINVGDRHVELVGLTALSHPHHLPTLPAVGDMRGRD